MIVLPRSFLEPIGKEFLRFASVLANKLSVKKNEKYSQLWFHG